MAILTGGIFSEHGAPGAAHRAVLREIRDYSPRTEPSDYVVDIAFVTGHQFGPDPIPIGVSPGPVGRTQRRFIVWHRLPEGMEDVSAVRGWFASALVDTEALVREYLPRKSKAYPATELASEVRSLRDQMSAVQDRPHDTP